MDVEKREPGIDLTVFTVTVFLYDKRYVPRSSLSRVQGYPQDGRHRRVKKDRERDKERTTQGEQASSVSEARLLYFPRGFYTLSYTHSKVKNAEFQRIARRDKKAFLSYQCKEIEGNNTMGKTRDLFKKIRDTKGTFHTKMGLIEDRNGMDLTEAEDIKKRWQEYTEELYKKDLHNPDNHDSVITHLEPDIL